MRSDDFFQRNSNVFVEAQYAGAVDRILENTEFEIEYDKSGNIISICFMGWHFRDEEEICQRLAPFMRNGNFFEFCNEMGILWRRVFTDGKCLRIGAVVLWPSHGAPADFSQHVRTVFAQHLMVEQ